MNLEYMKRNSLFTITMLGMMILSFSACDGILEGIYDTPVVEENKEYGFVTTDPATNSGTIYIDATDYKRWTFINFHTQKIDSVNVTDPEYREPAEWDIAVHRYDAKTNGGAVLETGSTGFGTLQNAGKMPGGTYVEDIWTTEKISVDMSGMMDGIIIYTESYYNEELSKWLKVDTSSMPPTYTPSNKVYMVKLKDGTYAAVRLSGYMNGNGVKGFMTIDYIYPFEL